MGGAAAAASLVACLAASPVAGGAVTAQADTSKFSQGVLSGGLAGVPLSGLPAQAQTTYRLILTGGPFPYSKDGVVFGNRERLLPQQAKGYYHEYTVKTPGAHNRGGRRIICGGQPLMSPAACYYTDDHYASFRRIQP
jgi:ribonuclease T1